MLQHLSLSHKYCSIGEMMSDTSGYERGGLEDIHFTQTKFTMMKLFFWYWRWHQGLKKTLFACAHMISLCCIVYINFQSLYPSIVMDFHGICWACLVSTFNSGTWKWWIRKLYKLFIGEAVQDYKFHSRYSSVLM